MKTIFFIFLSISSFAQTFTKGDTIYNFIENYKVPVARVKEGASRIITGTPGQAYFPRIIIAEGLGVMDTTKRVELIISMRVVNIPPPFITIDDVTSDIRNIYSPSTWAHFTNQSWLSTFFGASGSFINVTGATLTTSFNGYKVEWYTEKAKNHGIAAVSIDGGPETMVDLYANTTINNSQFVWSSPMLTKGQHTVKIRVTGTKNVGATESTIIHDYFKVYQ